jgi:hypothetical protein
MVRTATRDADDPCNPPTLEETVSLPSATVLGAVGLGAVGAVLAAGAALSAPNPSPRSDEQPAVVTTSTPLPCPAGTEDRGDSCVKVVVAPADPAPVATHRAPAAVADSSDAQESPEAEPSEVAESPDQEDGEDGEHDGEDSQEHQDSQEHEDGSDDGAEGGD